MILQKFIKSQLMFIIKHNSDVKFKGIYKFKKSDLIDLIITKNLKIPDIIPEAPKNINVNTDPLKKIGITKFKQPEEIEYIKQQSIQNALVSKKIFLYNHIN